MRSFNRAEALQNYITLTYKGNPLEWFIGEVGSPNQVYQANKIKQQKEYLNGAHDVLNRTNFRYKNAEFNSRKLVINLMNAIVNFHTSFLAGNRIKVLGNEERTRLYDKIYKKGNFDRVDYQLIRDITAHGNGFEYIFIDEHGDIQSHVISPDTAYPVYDDKGRYLAFIEYFTVEDRGYYIVYYEDRVEEWTNVNVRVAHPTLSLDATYANATGLPIVYKTFNNVNPQRGRAIMEDVKPLLDELEDTMSKMGDSINTWVMNPMPVVIGQRIENNIPTSAMGVVMNLEDGADFKFPNVNLDTRSIEYYINSLRSNILDMSYVPRIIFEEASVSNISTDSLRFFYQNAVIFANNTMRYCKSSFRERFRLFDELSGALMDDEVFDFDFDVALPSSGNELLKNLQVQRNMGAISIQSIIEQSPFTSDMATVEVQRLQEEAKDIPSEDAEGIEDEASPPENNELQ